MKQLPTCRLTTFALTMALAACSSSSKPAGTGGSGGKDAAAGVGGSPTGGAGGSGGGGSGGGGSGARDGAAAGADGSQADSAPPADRAADLLMMADVPGGSADTKVVDAAVPADVSVDLSADGATDTGPVLLAGTDNCANAPVIPLDQAHVNLPLDTTGSALDLAPPCATGGGDVFYTFNLPQAEVVYADTFGNSWNSIVFFATSCTGPALNLGTTACNDDACGTQQSQATALLPSGKYYLVVSGANGESGTGTVHFEHALAGRGPSALLAPGTQTLTGQTMGLGSLSLCEAAAAENSYWWATCSDFTGGMLMASTCTGTIFDTVLSLQIPRTGATICADDSCGFQSLLNTALPAGPGLHVLSVDGTTLKNAGAYSLVVTRP